jgi:hypothetical protein
LGDFLPPFAPFLGGDLEEFDLEREDRECARDERDDIDEFERESAGRFLGADMDDALDDDLESLSFLGEGCFALRTTSLVDAGVFMLEEDAELDSREEVLGSFSTLASASCIFLIMDKSNGIPLKEARGLLGSIL